MAIKTHLEQLYIETQTKSMEEKSTKNAQELLDLQTNIIALDQKISKLLQDQRQYFNPNWERMFRAGAEESYFAYQVERFACIYMEKLSDLLDYSPLTYFRANRRLLAHDIDFSFAPDKKSLM